MESERLIFERLAERAERGCGTHERTGPNSMLTSSKVVELIPQKPRSRTHGLWVGPQAEGGFVSGPCYGSVRNVIRDGVLVRPEAEVNERLQNLFDYGNYMEEVALRWLGQLIGPENVAPGGRLYHPKRRHMSSTPDGIAFYRGRTCVVEIKARVASIETDPLSPPQRYPPLYGGYYYQDNIVLDMGTPDVWVGMGWAELCVRHNSLVRPHHLVQTQMHMDCADVRYGLVVHVEPGYYDILPTLHLTEFEYQPALAAALMPYWDQAWALIEEGRERLRRGEEIPEDWPWKSGGLVSKHLPFDWEGPAVSKLDTNALAWRPF